MTLCGKSANSETEYLGLNYIIYSDSVSSLHLTLSPVVLVFLNQQIQVILPVFCLTQTMWMFKKLHRVCELANATLPVTEPELSHPVLSELVSTVNVCKPGKTPVFDPADLRMRLSHGDSLIHKLNIHEANLPVFRTPQRQSLQLHKCFVFSKATPVPSPLPVPALRVAMVLHILWLSSYC